MQLELDGSSKRSVIVDGSSIKIIKHAGIFSPKRERTIPIKHITSVQVKAPGEIWAGFIQFSTLDAIEKKSALSFTGGSFTAAKDENCILFSDHEAYETALKIKRYIEKYLETMPKSRSTKESSIADEIRKWKCLLEAGIITEARYDEEISQLLDI